MISTSRLCPSMTVLSTVSKSYLFWFWASTDMRSFLSSVTSPLFGSISPERTFKNVDLPAPFAPMMP